MKKYCGNTKPYIYTAFPSEYEEKSLSILERLSEDTVSFWFADDFSRREEKRLNCAFGVLLFTSDAFSKSEKYHKIVDCAVKNNKNILCVYLDDVKATPWSDMQLGSQLALFDSNYPDEDALVEKIREAQIFKDMSVTEAQKKSQMKKGLTIAAIPVLIAAVLFSTTIYPLLTKSETDSNESSAILERAGLTEKDLESVTSLTIVGDEVFTTFVHANYPNDSKDEIYYMIETGNGQERRGPIPVGTLTTEDLEILKSMPNLKSLAVEGQNIDDISPIFELEKLETLWLNCNPVSDISGIEKMQNLMEISLTDTNVTDISPLYELPKLNFIQIDNTYISDISGIENMPEMRSLLAGNSYVTELPVLQKKWNIGLGLSSLNNIKDFSSLAEYKSFGRLDLEGIPYERVLEYIKGIPIDTLLWNNNNAISLRQLEGIKMTSGSTLVLQGSNLISLDGIENFDDIAELQLQRQINITDFTPLLNLKILKHVILPQELKDMAEKQLKDAAFGIEYQ